MGKYQRKSLFVLSVQWAWWKSQIFGWLFFQKPDQIERQYSTKYLNLVLQLSLDDTRSQGGGGEVRGVRTNLWEGLKSVTSF